MRTQIASIGYNHSKFYVKFDTYAGVPGSEYIISSTSSSSVFDAEAAACEGAGRALDHFETYGHWPNMCEKF
jgi:hypothetical protein